MNMTLSELLVALSGNKNLFVKLADTTGEAIITFDAGGYEAVESDLGSRTVNSVEITSPTIVTVTIADA